MPEIRIEIISRDNTTLPLSIDRDRKFVETDSIISPITTAMIDTNTARLSASAWLANGRLLGAEKVCELTVDNL